MPIAYAEAAQGVNSYEKNWADGFESTEKILSRVLIKRSVDSLTSEILQLQWRKKKNISAMFF